MRCLIEGAPMSILKVAISVGAVDKILGSLGSKASKSIKGVDAVLESMGTKAPKVVSPAAKSVEELLGFAKKPSTVKRILSPVEQLEKQYKPKVKVTKPTNISTKVTSAPVPKTKSSGITLKQLEQEYSPKSKLNQAVKAQTEARQVAREKALQKAEQKQQNVQSTMEKNKAKREKIQQKRKQKQQTQQQTQQKAPIKKKKPATDQQPIPKPAVTTTSTPKSNPSFFESIREEMKRYKEQNPETYRNLQIASAGTVGVIGGAALFGNNKNNQKYGG